MAGLSLQRGQRGKASAKDSGDLEDVRGQALWEPGAAEYRELRGVPGPVRDARLHLKFRYTNTARDILTRKGIQGHLSALHFCLLDPATTGWENRRCELLRTDMHGVAHAQGGGHCGACGGR